LSSLFFYLGDDIDVIGDNEIVQNFSADLNLISVSASASWIMVTRRRLNRFDNSLQSVIRRLSHGSSLLNQFPLVVR
jgi:hypothetical protein